MSKWICVTGLDGRSGYVNSDFIETIEEPKSPKKVGAGSRLLWHNGDVESFVKETPEAIYAEIMGPPLANLDLLRGAIVVEATELGLDPPRRRFHDEVAISDWGIFADAMVTRLRNG